MSIERILHKLGIYSLYRGYAYLVYAIQYSIKNVECLQHLTKELYPEISLHFQSSVTGIERSLYTAIKKCWDHGNREYLMYLAGHELYRMPSPGEFISILTFYSRSCMSEQETD